MRVTARFVSLLAALALPLAGCGEESSSRGWSDCDYDEWCDRQGCHEREVCVFEQCTETWDHDFGEDEYAEECVRGTRTTEESESHDGAIHFRGIFEEGEVCVYVQEVDPWDYDESYSCSDYEDEETWFSECDAFGCRTEHCINGFCEWD